VTSPKEIAPFQMVCGMTAPHASVISVARSIRCALAPIWGITFEWSRLGRNFATHRLDIYLKINE